MIRIEICGGIATGKTALARCLTQDGAKRLIEENFRQVPFWKKSYVEPEKYSFEKNISFLLLHADSIRDAMLLEDPRPAVCDFAMFQDLSYAGLKNTQQDLHIIKPIYNKLISRINHPRLVVKLKCAPEAQLERIYNRGRVAEKTITKDFLIELNNQIDYDLAKLHKECGIVFEEINTNNMDFVTYPRALRVAAEINDRLRAITHDHAR